MTIRDQEQGGHPMRSWFQELQGLNDAITFRRARPAQPCPDCAVAEDRCDDHSCDVALILAFNLCCLPGSSLPVLSGASP